MVKNNEVRQLYVDLASTIGTSHLTTTTTTTSDGKSVTTSTPKGTMAYIANTFDKTFYLEQINALGEVLRTDIVDASKINYANLTKSTKMRTPLMRQKVVLDSTAIPQTGVDYVLNVHLKNFMSIGVDNFYDFYGDAHCGSSDTIGTIAAKIAVTLALNAKTQNCIKVYVSTSNTTTAATGETEITSQMEYKSGNIVMKGTGDTVVAASSLVAIVIEAVEQDWRRGVKPFEVPVFETYCKPFTNKTSGDVVTWGDVYNMTPNTYIENAKRVADLEWFLMGNRGDIYREMGYPNNIVTEYMVDVTTDEWDILDISYYYNGMKGDVQKSLKMLTIVAPEGNLDSFATALQASVRTLSGNSAFTVNVITES